MANSFWKTIAPYATRVGSTAIGTTGALSEGREAYRAGRFDYQSLRQRAAATEQSGRLSLMQFNRLANKLQGTQRAVAASGGPISGSALDVMADTAAQLDLERQNMAAQTAAEASAYRTQADESRRAGVAKRRQGYLKAGGVLLEGSSRLFDML